MNAANRAILGAGRRARGGFLVAAFATFFVFMSAGAAAAQGPRWHVHLYDRDAYWWELVGYYAILAATTLWFFVLGSMIGSFLNVVAYRLPLGKNLLWPPSSCPKCQARIRATDNLPVIGWLRLGGRCRDCREPISPRYPLVEAACGAMFFALAFVELFTGGGNLPVRPVDLYPGVVWNALYFASDAIALYFFHAVMLSALLAVALIDHDRLPTPTWAMLIPLTLAALLAATIRPGFQPVPFAEAIADERWSAGLQTLGGAALGLLLGRRLWPGGNSAAALALALVGVFQGWQATAAAALLTFAVWLAVSWLRRRLTNVSISAYISIGWIAWACAFLHLVLWRKWASHTLLPGPATPVWAWAGWIWIAVIIFLVQNDLRKKNPASAGPGPRV
jgi:leader peptidase (prepilin peptidase)/N-methyltransferase